MDALRDGLIAAEAHKAVTAHALRLADEADSAAQTALINAQVTLFRAEFPGSTVDLQWELEEETYHNTIVFSWMRGRFHIALAQRLRWTDLVASADYEGNSWTEILQSQKLRIFAKCLKSLKG
jgi:hypothetical protein